jgi:hypothetical protein
MVVPKDRSQSSFAFSVSLRGRTVWSVDIDDTKPSNSTRAYSTLSSLSPLNSLPLFSKAKIMTFSSKSYSSPPPVLRNNSEQIHHRHPLYSTAPQLTLIDVLVMQAQAQAQVQVQAPPSGGFATMTLWTGGDPVPSSPEERQALVLAAMIAVLNDDTTPSESADDRRRNDPHDSPNEPSAQ